MLAFRVVAIFLSVWLVSTVAFSNGSLAPELSILTNAKSAAEYPILRRLQDLTLELQLLEITIKNRRDSETEQKITTALTQVENEGNDLALKFKAIRTEQQSGLYAILSMARRLGPAVGVSSQEWEEIFEAASAGTLNSGTIVVHGKTGTLNVVTLMPLYLGKQVIWNVALPQSDSKSFWVKAKRTQKIPAKLLNQTIAGINAPFNEAEKQAKAYFSSSYAKLYSAFDTHRYAILQRVNLARRALAELSRTNGAMGTPEEFSSLYNQVLDNLFSYGVDISLSGLQRDFAIKGFLFGDSPESAQALISKLKFSPHIASSYNSPSS